MAFWWFGPLTWRTRRGGRVTVGGLVLTIPALGAYALATARRPPHGGGGGASTGADAMGGAVVPPHQLGGGGGGEEE